VPLEIINKTGHLAPDEWAVIRAHPVMGAETVIRMKEWGELSTRMVSGAFEHHLKYDLSGYPKLARKKKIGLFSRIITLLTSLMRWSGQGCITVSPMSRRRSWLHAGAKRKGLRPDLVKVFVNMLGVYPLGTLVLLNTNEMGLVVQAQEDNELIDRPRVCLLSYSDGEYRKGRVLDLREMDEGTRNTNGLSPGRLIQTSTTLT